MKKIILPALITIAAGASIAFPSKVHSSAFDKCDRDYNGKTLAQLTNLEFAQNNQNGCSHTPDKYEIVIYEMGLCTGNSSPIGGGTLDRTGCTATFANAAGQTVDLAGSASITLDSASATAPSPATYKWGYMVMKNTFGLKGSLATQSTWRTTSNSMASKTATSNVEFTETLSNFDELPTCDADASADMPPLGTMTAMLTNSNLVKTTTCTDVTRLVGAFSPTTSYTITPSTTALKMTFKVTDNGMMVIPNPQAPYGVAQFGSGPFQMDITVVE